MTDNEIIKALERLSAEDPDGFSAEVLEMVNCQKAKIEKLEKARQKQGQLLSEERKQKYDLIDKLSQVRIAAYKEFAKQLRAQKGLFCSAESSELEYVEAVEFLKIENLLRELVGEDE